MEMDSLGVSPRASNTHHKQLPRDNRHIENEETGESGRGGTVGPYKRTARLLVSCHVRRSVATSPKGSISHSILPNGPLSHSSTVLSTGARTRERTKLHYGEEKRGSTQDKVKERSIRLFCKTWGAAANLVFCVRTIYLMEIGERCGVVEARDPGRGSCGEGG